MTVPPVLWELMADLDKDGVYEADFTPFLRGIGGYEIRREDALGAFGPRKMSVDLANTDARFSPKNTSGPYGPNLKRGRKVRLRATPGVTFPDTTNLGENPSAEINIGGHATTGGSTVVRSTDEAYYGKASVKVTVANTTSSGDYYRKSDGTGFVVAASTAYSFHVRVKAPAGKLLRIRIDWHTAADAFVSSSTTTDFTGTGSWQLVQHLNMMSPGTGVRAKILVITPSAQGVFDFYGDGYMFYQGADLRPYVDGDMPRCTWAVSAHSSQSTRTLADQEDIVQFTGRIVDFGVSRTPQLQGTTALECSSDDEAWWHKVISCGYFLRKKGKDIAQVLVDRLEEGEIIFDGQMRSAPTGGVPSSAFGPPEGETFNAIGGLQMLHTPVAAQFYEEAFEGDCAMSRTLFNDSAGDGWSVTKSFQAQAGVSYTAAAMFGNPTGLNAGKRWLFELWDDVGGVVGTSVVTLVNGWTYQTVTGTYTAGSAQRVVQLTALDTPLNESKGLIVDCLHMVPTANRIARTVSGLDYVIEVFPQAGFHRSAAAILEEFGKSATAIIYEDASGGLVFEQADTSRSSTAVPKLRLTDGVDGMNYESGEYEEAWNQIYNRVRVGSYGAITDLNVVRRPWSLEPSPLVLGASEERVLYVDFVTEEEGPVIGRIGNAKAILSAGSLAANYPILRNYGASAEVVLKATGSGATVIELWVEAKSVKRNTSERSFVEYEPAGALISEPKVLELETPGQGYKNARMTALVTWAGDKYVTGPAQIPLAIPAGRVGTDAEGIQGWERVMEIIGRDVGLPVQLKHKGGQSQMHLDGLFYVEGRRVSQGALGEVPRVELSLEAA